MPLFACVINNNTVTNCSAAAFVWRCKYSSVYHLHMKYVCMLPVNREILYHLLVYCCERSTNQQ